MKISYPMIILNFKGYRELLNKREFELAKIAEKISRESGVSVAVCPSLVNIAKIAEAVEIPVLAQHCDPYEPGAYTGSVVAEFLKEAGVVGSLLNHSEKRLRLSDIAATVTRLRLNGLISVVCADDIHSSSAAAVLSPDALAVEPPELIGTGISVSTAKPEVVSGTVEKVKSLNRDVHVLCGAGVSTAEDVNKALRLGTEGVLLSSAYVKSRDPEKLLKQMCEAVLI